MRVAELWRYPVKSLAGERLEARSSRSTGSSAIGSSTCVTSAAG